MIIEAFKNYEEFQAHKRDPRATIRLINARQAEQGKEYYCPFCGTSMFLKHSVNDTAFYAHWKGEPHKERICKTISSKQTVCEIDIPDFDAAKFLKKLIPEPVPDADDENDVPPGYIRTSHGNLYEVPSYYSPEEYRIEMEYAEWTPGPGEEDGPVFSLGRPKSEASEYDSDDDSDEDDPKPLAEDASIQVTPAKAIKDVINLGYERLPGDQIINHAHTIRVNDLILSVPSFSEFFRNPEILNDTDRIVEMRPSTMRDKDNVIICRAFRRVSENDYASIYFYLRFNSKKEYNSQVKKIFTKEEWRGKYTIEEKYESIFVCAHWMRSKTPHKFKGSAWPRFDAVITKASTQMYSPSHYRKAK